jgi:Raf kinase inhibitor-like protein, YbhB/YbcL family
MGGNLTLESPAFADGGTIPPICGYKKGNVSPALEWSLPPSGTRSFALLVEDPDARGWVHWIAWNIPYTAHGLPEGVPRSGPACRRDPAREVNDFGEDRLRGTLPPFGSPPLHFPPDCPRYAA